MNLKQISDACLESPAFLEKRLQKISDRIAQGAGSNAFIRTYPMTAPESGEFEKSPGLYGLVFSVKDNIAVQGQPVSLGIRPEPVKRSALDAQAVSDIRNKGALLCGSTNMDPMAVGSGGLNIFFGPINNPAKPGTSPSGSGGGAAVSVANGYADFALGTDSGGSIRLPALACDVCGIKLSPGILPRSGMFLLEDRLDSPGIIAKDTTALCYILEKILGPDQTDPGRGIPGLLIPADSDLRELEYQDRKKFDRITEILYKHIPVSQTKHEMHLREQREIRKIMIARLLDLQIKKMAIDPSLLPPEPQALSVLADTLSDQICEQALRDRKAIAGIFDEMLNERNLLLTPGGSTNRFMIPANLCGLPAVCRNVPLEAGSAFPVQFLGREGSDYALVRAAAEVQLYGL